MTRAPDPVADAPRQTPGSALASSSAASATAYLVLAAISLSHFFNDLMQSLLAAVYPILKQTYGLSYGEIGLITLVNQFTASLLQPVVGLVTDRRPFPYSLAVGMSMTLAGILLLANASIYGLILLAAALIGIGSSVFHPESSRLARMASGGRHGFAQSFFQVGGNLGSATGPLLAALIVVPFGQGAIAWFAVFALAGIAVLTRVGGWYKSRIGPRQEIAAKGAGDPVHRRVLLSVGLLIVLILSKQLYLASLSSYYALYLMHKFGLSAQAAQLYLFVLLVAIAAGTLTGGPIGDRIGRKYVILASIFGALPFTLALPYAGPGMTIALSIVIGFVIASAFPAIVVYGQELMPRNIGAVSGFFFGFAFGVGGVGAAALGALADRYGIDLVYQIVSFLPALGIIAVLLPDIRSRRVAM